MTYILGIVVSLLVAWLKKVYGTEEYKTLFILVLVSIASAAVYVLFRDTSMWKTVITILEAAGAFYAFVIQRFQK